MDPLKNTTKLVEEATKCAQKLLKEELKGTLKAKMSAMEFCRSVLKEGFGLPEWGVGQRQRIVISKARKEVFGKQDSKFIKAPTKAATVHLPSTQMVYQQLSQELSVAQLKIDSQQATKTVESALDETALKEQGIVHIPGVVPPKKILEILKYWTELEDNDKLWWTYLRPTTGNGQQGAYASLPSTTNTPSCLEDLQNDIRGALQSKLGVTDCGTKTILLKYGLGGINWAHQDQSSCPYQALLLLSRPGFDFGGGHLYVSDPSSVGQDGRKCIRHEAKFQSMGDVVVFAANSSNATGRPFYHGMSKVLLPETDGCKEEDCHRLAVGLLQT